MDITSVQDVRVCVICHMYYLYMWDEIKSYIKNLEPFVKKLDLYLTYSGENNEFLQNTLNSFGKNVKVEVLYINNPKGADIAPFIMVLNQINLDNYDLIYKVHTKRTLEIDNFKLNNVFCFGSLWRAFMLNQILGKKNAVSTLLKFKNNKNLGIYGFAPFLLSIPSREYAFLPQADYLFEKYNNILGLKYTDTYKFYAGTIFVIRANILKLIQNKFKQSDFQDGEKFSKVAYDMEGLFGYITKVQGYGYYSNVSLTALLLRIFSHKNRFAKYLFKFYVNSCIFGKKII